MRILAWILFTLGTYVVVCNFWLSFVRFPLHRRRGGMKDDFQFVSILPFFGSFLLVIAALCFWGDDQTFLMWLSVALAFLDTGGVHVMIATVLWYEKVAPWLARRRSGRNSD